MGKTLPQNNEYQNINPLNSIENILHTPSNLNNTLTTPDLKNYLAEHILKIKETSQENTKKINTEYKESLSKLNNFLQNYFHMELKNVHSFLYPRLYEFYNNWSSFQYKNEILFLLNDFHFNKTIHNFKTENNYKTYIDDKKIECVNVILLAFDKQNALKQIIQNAQTHFHLVQAFSYELKNLHQFTSQIRQKAQEISLNISPQEILSITLTEIYNHLNILESHTYTEIDFFSLIFSLDNAHLKKLDAFKRLVEISKNLTHLTSIYSSSANNIVNIQQIVAKKAQELLRGKESLRLPENFSQAMLHFYDTEHNKQYISPEEILQIPQTSTKNSHVYTQHNCLESITGFFNIHIFLQKEYPHNKKIHNKFLHEKIYMLKNNTLLSRDEIMQKSNNHDNVEYALRIQPKRTLAEAKKCILREIEHIEDEKKRYNNNNVYTALQQALNVGQQYYRDLPPHSARTYNILQKKKEELTQHTNQDYKNTMLKYFKKYSPFIDECIQEQHITDIWKKILQKQKGISKNNKLEKKFFTNTIVYIFKNISHFYGYSINQSKLSSAFKNNTQNVSHILEKVWNTHPPEQIPLGIGYRPQRINEKTTKSIGLLRAFFQTELEADLLPKKKTTFIIYDRQKYNYLYFKTLSKEDFESPQQFVIKMAIRQKKFPEPIDFRQILEDPEYCEHIVHKYHDMLLEVAHNISTQIAKKDKAYYESLAKKFNLKHIDIQTSTEIESKNPGYKKLKKCLKEIIYRDSILYNMLLNTVDDRFKKKAGIGIEGKKDPSKEYKQRIIENLAEYAIDIITHHIFSLGDTITHKAEQKNYAITKAILKNKQHRKKILHTAFSPELTEKKLLNLQFPQHAYFQGESLDENPAPEDYKTPNNPHAATSILHFNQILLNEDPLTWINFLRAHPQKRNQFLHKVCIPLICGYFHTQWKNLGRHMLEAELQSFYNWENVIHFISHHIIGNKDKDYYSEKLPITY